MKEALLHYVWQNKLFYTNSLSTTDGETVEVIDTGKLNTDAGPDFFNAKIKIGDTLWAGNVEIHSRTSDWERHQHQSDKAYDNIILHVVANADTAIFRPGGEQIPQLILSCPTQVEENFEELVNCQQWIRCADKLNQIPDIHIQAWKNALVGERLEQKTDAIKQLLEQSNQHWEEAFYITLARSFGFGTNSQAFENLARSLPVNILGRHKDNLLQLEALLLGQAGLLYTSDNDDDHYLQLLRKEYDFLKTKYSLQTGNVSQWKMLRLRPDNFPHIRLAQFSTLIHKSSKLFSKILENTSRESLQNLFACSPSDYWQTHYTFGNESSFKSKKLGQKSVDILLINTVVPYLFSYASHKGDENLKEKALKLLEEIPAENNAIINKWKELGMKAETAYDTQALLHLKKNYCEEKKCLRCRIGHKVLTTNKNEL